MVKQSLIQLIALFFINVVYPQYGVLDPTFGNGGKVITAFGTESSFMKAIAIQSDGKILAGGSVNVEGQNHIGLAKYNTDGTLDTTFADQGKIIVPIVGFSTVLTSIALQLDGKILACGKLYNPVTFEYQLVLIRFTTNGTLDSAFGNQGVAIAFDSEESNDIKAFALQPDGKIVAVGYVSDSATYSNFLMLRLNSDGSPDAGFGTNGVVNIGFQTMDYANALTVLPTGKILVVGKSSDDWDNYYGYDYDFIIAQFNPDGTLDESFGDEGRSIIAAVNDDEALYVNVQSDSKILIAGEYGSYPYGFELVKLLSNGTLDDDFGTNGIVKTELPSSYIQAIATQPDGKIVAAGYYNPGSCCSAPRLFRFMASGALDSTFGTDGIVSNTTDVGQTHGILLQPDGKIVICASGGIGFGPVHYDFTMYRYLSGLTLSNTDFDSERTNLKIYPNPMEDLLHVNFTIHTPETISMDLYDYSGKKIVTLLLDQLFSPGLYSQVLELPNALPKGFYFLNVSDGKGNNFVKLIK